MLHQGHRADREVDADHISVHSRATCGQESPARGGDSHGSSYLKDLEEA